MRRLANKKRLIALIVVITMVGSSIIAIAFSNKESDIVAQIEGEAITRNELVDYLMENYGNDALNQLIVDKILLTEVEKRRIEVTDEEVQEEIDLLIEEYGSEELFLSILEYSGMTLADLKKSYRMNLYVDKVLRPGIIITDEETENYFEANKLYLGQEEEVRASHILVETEDLALDIKEKLDKGEDFAELAKEYSTDPGSKDNGGDLGFFGKGVMVKSFQDAAFSMEIGEISQPVESSHGYHIIKLEDKTEAKEANYEEVKDQIKETILQERLPEEYQIWIQQKLSEYNIETYIAPF